MNAVASVKRKARLTFSETLKRVPIRADCRVSRLGYGVLRRLAEALHEAVQLPDEVLRQHAAPGPGLARLRAEQRERGLLAAVELPRRAQRNLEQCGWRCVSL